MSRKVDDRIDGHKATLHRTAHYTQAQVDRLEESATPQEITIARWYVLNPAGESPTWLHEEQGFGWPITSTRRAITNLTEAGILVKTEQIKTSVHGRPEHVWRWRTPEDEPVEPEQLDAFGEPEKRPNQYSEAGA